MNKTEFLKILIQKTEMSMKAFSQKADIPYSTLRSMLERGIENASVNNVIKVCKSLGITVEELYRMADDKPNKQKLTAEENELLENYNRLNTIGKKKLIDYSLDLTGNMNYLINGGDETTATVIEFKNKSEIWEEEGKQHLMPIAAHAKDGKITDEEYEHDIDLMRNDNLWK